MQPADQVATGFADLNHFHDMEEFEDPLQCFFVQCKRLNTRTTKPSGECVVICGIFIAAIAALGRREPRTGPW